MIMKFRGSRVIREISYVFEIWDCYSFIKICSLLIVLFGVFFFSWVMFVRSFFISVLNFVEDVCKNKMIVKLKKSYIFINGYFLIIVIIFKCNRL